MPGRAGTKAKSVAKRKTMRVAGKPGTKAKSVAKRKTMRVAGRPGTKAKNAPVRRKARPKTKLKSGLTKRDKVDKFIRNNSNNPYANLLKLMD